MRTLVLAGAGEFTDAMNAIDQMLVNELKEPSVIIIPTAAGKEKSFMKWIDDGVKHFSKLHVKVTGIPVIQREDSSNQEYIDAVRATNFIYFSGGDPSYVLEVIKGTPLWDVIYERYMDGAILAGSSAGAMMMGSKVMNNPSQFFFKQQQIKLSNGIGLIPFMIIPHFDRIPSSIKYILQQMIKVPYIGIDEDTVLIVNDEKRATVKGKGTVFLHTEINTTFTANQKIDLQK